MADLHQFAQSLLVVRGEQVVLERRPEEGSDVVPVLFDRVFGVLQVVVPVSFQLVGEYAELLVVGIFVNCRPSL